MRQLAGAADLAAAIEAGSRLLTDCTELIGQEDRVTLAARHALAIAYKLKVEIAGSDVIPIRVRMRLALGSGSGPGQVRVLPRSPLVPEPRGAAP